MAKPAQKFDPPQPQTPKERLVAIETLIPTLATKADFARLEEKVDAIAANKADRSDLRDLEIRIIRWFAGTAIAIVGAVVGAQIGIAFLIIRALSGG